MSRELFEMDQAERYCKMPVDRVLAWITDYVLPAIEEVYERPTFRDHATWAQRTLAPDTDGPERAAVERVDRCLVEAGKTLHQLTRYKLVQRNLEKTVTASPRSPGNASDAPCKTRNRRNRRLEKSPALIPAYVEQVAAVADRCWTDLVCMNDYFGPVGGMMRTTPLPKGVTEGAFVVSLAPRLYFVGDSVTRCMMQRVRSWIGLLDEARTLFLQAVAKAGRRYGKQVEAEAQAWTELLRNWDELQGICLAGSEAPIREGCIGLIQVYAEFHFSPALTWLGIPAAMVTRFKGQLRHSIEHSRDLETADRIAGALHDARLIYRDTDPEESAIDDAIATGNLVLLEARREVYWQKERIDVDWNKHKRPWEFLWKLALNARYVKPVKDWDLYLDAAKRSTMANRWKRLKDLLPKTLARHVYPGEERATYVLKLPNRRAHLFKADVKTVRRSSP
jgi:hypothetical protein